jgi:hypothetical protein
MTTASTRPPRQAGSSRARRRDVFNGAQARLGELAGVEWLGTARQLAPDGVPVSLLMAGTGRGDWWGLQGRQAAMPSSPRRYLTSAELAVR